MDRDTMHGLILLLLAALVAILSFVMISSRFDADPSINRPVPNIVQHD